MTPCKQRKLILAKNTIKNRITKITTRQEESPEKKKTRKHKKHENKITKKTKPAFSSVFFLVFLVGVLFSFCFFLDFGFLVCFFWFAQFFLKLFVSMKAYILCAAGLINIVDMVCHQDPYQNCNFIGCPVPNWETKS